MSNPPSPKPLKRIKTGFLERRLELARASMVSGTKMLGYSAGNLFTPVEEREQRKKKMLSQQALYFVDELGKLKGSVVKIGQMMALYGKYFLPREITDALHKLEDNTIAMDWPGIEKAIRSELGDPVMAELTIDPKPLAAASLGQVHRATRISDGKQLCIKVQYPGVAKSIDGDFNAVIRLLRVAKLINKDAGLHKRLEKIREALHQEVDYHYEAQKTIEVARRLTGDNRFIVPEVFSEYSTGTVLTTSFEDGVSITNPSVQSLSLERRNAIGKAMLDLSLTELFEWGEIQIDPNFGNFRVRLSNKKQINAEASIETPKPCDQLVLLDFGAMREFPSQFLNDFRGLLRTAHCRDKFSFKKHAIGIGLMQSHFPKSVVDQLTQLGFEIVEPLKKDHFDTLAHALNSQGHYSWHTSKLPKRAGKMAGNASLSKHFVLPPIDFMFVLRKLIGVYTFIHVLEAEFDGYPALEKHLSK